MHLNPAFSHAIALYLSLHHAQTPFNFLRHCNSVNYCDAVMSKSLLTLNCFGYLHEDLWNVQFHFPYDDLQPQLFPSMRSFKLQATDHNQIGAG
jgi:hypothetical protein